MDAQTLQTILTVGIGALGTALVGVVGAVFGAWLNGRREQQRWLRAERLVAYRRFMTDGDFLNIGIERVDKEVRLTPEAKRAALEAPSALGLLGPVEVYNAGLKYQDSTHNLFQGTPDGSRPTQEEITGLRNDLAKLMQAELGVPKGQRFGAPRPE